MSWWSTGAKIIAGSLSYWPNPFFSRAMIDLGIKQLKKYRKRIKKKFSCKMRKKEYIDNAPIPWRP